jgi:Flp pilus assembly protein TadD/predicted Ser/Thr protein kinase
LCEAYLEKYPREIEVRRIHAHAHLKTGQSGRAIDEYERLLDEGPENDRVVNDLGLAYAETERTDDRAISIYKRALRVAPESATLLRALARAHVERGDLQEAIERLREAMRARKESAGDVIEDCERLLKADSSRTALRWFLCEVLIRNGRFREATEHLRLLYERDPSEHERAMKALGRILEVDPENTRAHRARGEMLLRLGAIARARTDLEKADTLKPNEEETETLLREVYEKILQETEDAEVRFRLGRIYRRFDDLDAALRCFQKSVHDYRFETESIREMGKIFMDKNLLDLALEEFQKLSVDEDLKETLYRLGQMYEQRGDPGGARAAYRILFAADAGFRDVQKRFETLSGDGSGDRTALDRTMIISQLSEKAKHRYKLLEEIGRGAMGIVYRAMDSELDEVVALKILPDNLSSNDDALTRFRREARSARRLSHRNIVRIHDIGEEMGRKYISMEFVEGTTLKALIRASGGLDVVRTVKYGAQILDALAYAHSIGIVHRDIKPANIIISRDDEVKITDFGIAKILESTDATAEGAVVGTPLYMSPEQVRGEPVDHRADIYSVGILLYESIEGRPPFLKGDLAYSHLHVFPDPMTRGPQELNDVVLQALEKRKEDRWTSAQAMLDALQVLREGS